MGIPIQTPTLAELLATYQAGQIGNGVANGITQASTNFNNTARTTADIAAQRAQAAAQQEQLRIQQQQANTAEAEQRSKIISPEDYSTVTNGGAPSGPVNQTLLDAVIKQKAMAQEQANAIASRESIAEQARLAREQELAIANKTRQSQIATTAQTSRNAQYETAGKNLEGLHWYDKLFNTDANKGVKAGFNYAAGQVGAPGLNGTPAGMTKIQASDGSMHYVPDVDAARKIDPNLKVIQ